MHMYDPLLAAILVANIEQLRREGKKTNAYPVSSQTPVAHVRTREEGAYFDARC